MLVLKERTSVVLDFKLEDNMKTLPGCKPVCKQNMLSHPQCKQICELLYYVQIWITLYVYSRIIPEVLTLLNKKLFKRCCQYRGIAYLLFVTKKNLQLEAHEYKIRQCLPDHHILLKPAIKEGPNSR